MHEACELWLLPHNLRLSHVEGDPEPRAQSMPVSPIFLRPWKRTEAGRAAAGHACARSVVRDHDAEGRVIDPHHALSTRKLMMFEAHNLSNGPPSRGSVGG